jgi:hypothetical protein
MNRSSFGAVTAIALLAACGAEDSPTDPASVLQPQMAVQAGNPVVGTVTGSGIVDRDPSRKRYLRSFTISAVGRADLSAEGQWNLIIGPNDFSAHGTITCASFDGTSAYVGGTWERSAFPDDLDATITGVAIELIDNGEGTHGPADLISQVYFYQGGPATPQDWCENPVPGPVMPITQGNVSVH